MKRYRKRFVALQRLSFDYVRFSITFFTYEIRSICWFLIDFFLFHFCRNNKWLEDWRTNDVAHSQGFENFNQKQANRWFRMEHAQRSYLMCVHMWIIYQSKWSVIKEVHVNDLVKYLVSYYPFTNIFLAFFTL